MIKTKFDGLILKIIEAIVFLYTIHYSYIIALESTIFAVYKEKNYIAYESNTIYILVCSLVILLINNSFDGAKKSKMENIVNILISTLMIQVTIMAVVFLTRGFGLPRTVILQASIIQFIVLSVVKITFVYIVNQLRGIKKVMIIADFDDFDRILPKFFSNSGKQDLLLYYIDPKDFNYRHYLKDVQKIILSEKVSNEVKNDIINRCLINDITLFIVPKMYEITLANATMFNYSDLVSYRVDTLKLSLEKRILKRGFDITLSVIGILILSPLFLILSILILLFEGKPIFYTQERTTINNKVFKILKFRTMINNAEESTGAVISSSNDNRVTPIGKFLRRFWLDELPQLFNVLKGDMSMVGPRPERPFFIDEISKVTPDFKYRLSVKAGVTGLSQVIGKYSTIPEDKIRFDLIYIKNSNLVYDFKIIIETVKKIVIGTLKRGTNEDDSIDDIISKNSIDYERTGNIIEFSYQK